MLKNILPKKIPLSTPHMSGLEMKYINEAFQTNWIAPLGPNVDAFENEFSNYIGSEGAVAVSSGTAAIHLALDLLNVGKGDIVFCSSLTFVATANPIIYQGAKPVFIDSENDTWNMSPRALEIAFIRAKKQGKLPKAVIVVHLYGQCAKMDELISICREYDVPLIEDAAESLGATYKGKRCGTMGDFGIFSFNGNKIITTSGGGMLVSNNLKALEKARFLASQAKDPAPHYQHSEVGYNYRLSNILAGVGRGQLSVLEDRITARRNIYKLYQESLEKYHGIEFMPEMEGSFSTRWLTVITVIEKNSGSTRDDILNNLEQADIEARKVWKPLHLQPLFKDCDFYSEQEDKSISETLFLHGICLPSGSNMTNEQQMRVIQSIKNMIVQ